MKLSFFSILLVTSIACASAVRAGTELSVARLGSDNDALTNYSGITDHVRLVVRDERTWRELWRRIHGSASPPELPSIDFRKEMIVIASLGEHPTGGPTILIGGAVAEANDGVRVKVRNIELVGPCLVTEAFTQPVDVARLPRRDGPVTFEDVIEKVPCR
jgi:hypothetical protein